MTKKQIEYTLKNLNDQESELLVVMTRLSRRAYQLAKNKLYLIRGVIELAIKERNNKEMVA